MSKIGLRIKGVGHIKIERHFFPESVERRFWKKVEKKGEDDCWEWKAASNQNGHGSFCFMGRTLSAHHMALCLHLGAMIPDRVKRIRVCVLHKCDNPSCCNPSHLFTGTYSFNSKDSVHKGRWVNNKGQRHGMSKLSDEQVLDMRRKWKTGKYSKYRLAKMNGVSWERASSIVQGESWKHLPI
jgi:hypothetical protein